MESVVFRENIFPAPISHDPCTFSIGFVRENLIFFSFAGCPVIIILPAVSDMAVVEGAEGYLILLSIECIALVYRSVAAVAYRSRAMEAVLLLGFRHNIDDAAHGPAAVKGRLTAGYHFNFPDIFHWNHIPVHIPVPGRVHRLTIHQHQNIPGIISSQIHRTLHRLGCRYTGHHSHSLGCILHIPLLDILLRHHLYIGRHILQPFRLPVGSHRNPLQRIHRHLCLHHACACQREYRQKRSDFLGFQCHH